MADDKMPPQPTTKALPAMTDRALLEDLGRVVRNMADAVGSVRQDVTILMDDRPALHSRIAGIEGRLARIETPSIAPPAPLTSTRVHAIINEHPSQMDLDTAAQLGVAIGALNEERAKREQLEKSVVTKEDVATVVSDATAAQTVALVTKLSENKKLGVIAGLIAAIVIGWLGRFATAPTPPAPTPAPQVQK